MKILLEKLKLIEKYNVPEYLYHGTYTKNIPSILKHGLDPKFTKSSGNMVYLACDEYTARNYSDHHIDNDSDWIILRVLTHKLNKNNLEPDDYELHDYIDYADDDDKFYGYEFDDFDWLQSLEAVCQCGYSNIISPELIEIQKK
jgi:hypothetical protein